MQQQYFLVYLFLFLSGLSFFHCDFKEEAGHITSPIEKEYPNDHFTFQRSFPYKKFDIKAYDQGLKAAQLADINRSSSPGFEEGWTNQGPGNFGGRVNTIEVHPTDEDIIYLGFATGGVWKTTDGGTNWVPIFDEQTFLAIGDITMDPNDPETIYVGTGDANISGYPAIGDGLYRSTNGGANWVHLGLQDQRIISKIIIDPNDSNTLYVSCMGLPFERNTDRGLYKSSDGGSTWQQILFVSDQAGIIDMVMDPSDTNTLYAASWDRIRNNEESVVSGPNGKIHKTTDGGLTWTVLTNGLPVGDTGRIGLDISKSNPNTLVSVYISTNQNLEGIYRTEDGGTNWAAIPTSSSNGLGTNVTGGFGWYFGQIRLHPNNDNWIYLLTVQAWFTSNNGAVWSTATGSGVGAPHVDYHDLVFNFQNDILIGNDGGAYKRESNVTGYVDIENIPSTQFYRVAYDPHRPENFYGGTQDNGTLKGNELSINDWTRLLGGDGFQMQFHPDDSLITFAETQRGNIFRSTSGLTGFINATAGINFSDRRNWDMQYIISPHQPNRLYTGTYRVYRSESVDFPSWSAISPDLTDGIIYGDGFHTITTLDESDVIEDLVYVGTSDGNVWKTDDGGTTWDSLHANLPNRYITSVKADPDSADHVYVCVSGYRYNENIPRVYRSVNRGTDWTSISGNLPDLAVNDILIVPGQSGQVLFVATDGGVYGSTNGGTTWERVGTDFPMVTTYDLTWNEAQNLLVAGTFGRSIYSYPIDSVLNNIAPTFSISGQLKTENDMGIDSAFVNFNGTANAQTSVDANGFYQINNLTQISNCSIEPTKNINIRNGISTLDILRIRRHILNIDTLDSPYKILAGDLNQSNSLSTFDLVILQRTLLLFQDTFIQTPSWKFVPADYVFQNPINPFEEDYAEAVTCAEIENGASADFVGFKMGDVNASASPGMLTEEVEDRSTRTLDWQIEDQWLERGEKYRIPILMPDDQALLGFQFALQFADQVQFEKLEAGDGWSLEEKDYNYTTADQVLRVSWYDPYAVQFKAGTPLLFLTVRTTENVQLSDAMQLRAPLLRPEAYEQNYTIIRPRFIFQTVSDEFQFYPVFPNPITNNCTISWSSDLEEETEIAVYDVHGQLVSMQKLEGQKGLQEYQLSAAQWPGSGVYFIRVSVGMDKIVQRVVKVE